MPSIEKLQEGHKGFAVLIELLKIPTLFENVEGYENLASDSFLVNLSQKEIEQYNENLRNIKTSLINLTFHFIKGHGSQKGKKKHQKDIIKIFKDHKNLNELELIWCSSLPSQTFNITELTYQALELASQLRLQNIIYGLNDLWPHFSSFQKGYALLILWQFRTFSILPSNEIEKTILSLISHEKTNKFYDELKTNLSTCKLAPPHTTEISFAKTDFLSLVKKAIEKQIDSLDNQDEIQQIASELQMLTLQFYQDLKIDEFNKAHLDKNDPNQTPGLSRMLNFYNKLSNFFITLALQDKEITKTENVLKVFIKIAHLLCTTNHPDLNHITLIGSIFHKHQVHRLLNMIKFDSYSQQQLIELMALVSIDEGQTACHHFLEKNKSALQFTGLLKNALILYPSVLESENFKEDTKNKGFLLLQIWRTKLFSLMVPIHFKTNLLDFLESKELFDDEFFSSWSLAINPNRRRSLFSSSSAPTSSILPLEDTSSPQESSSAPQPSLTTGKSTLFETTQKKLVTVKESAEDDMNDDNKNNDHALKLDSP